MMSRPRPSLPVGHALRALALAAAALGVASSPAAPAAPVVVAQLGGVPTSPGFKMNLGHNDGSPAEHVESGDKPASAGKDAKEGKPAAAAKAHEGKGEESPHGEKKTESAKHGESKPAAKTEAKGVEDPNASADPMDVLREKLAAKLGAKPASDGKFVMQVSNRGESGENIISSVRPSAAAMAAGKRAAARKAGQAASASGDPELNANIAAHGGGALLPTHWDYAGAGGPDAWGKLKPEYSQCSSGSRQSPIDIRDGISVDLDPIKFDYHPSAFSVIDNGHTVQVNVEAGNTITITGRRFELQQFHFHRPSEERINGRQFDMVAHLVHRDQDGKLAVIAVLLDRGSAQAVVQMVWNNLPLEKGQEARAASKLDLAQLLPQDKRYYTYMGSLTTPPCSEGVLWMVMKQPVPISADQLAIFSHLYPMNARPIQQADGRLIKQSN